MIHPLKQVYNAFHALFLIAWLADRDSLMCCLVMFSGHEFIGKIKPKQTWLMVLWYNRGIVLSIHCNSISLCTIETCKKAQLGL